MLLRCNEGISPKFFDSQDDGLFRIERKGAPMNQSLLISLFTNMLLGYKEGISPKLFDSQDDGLFQNGRKGAPISSH